MTTLWDVLSWIANCQLAGNDANILGLLWSVILAFVGYRWLRSFPSFKVKPQNKYFWLAPFLLSVTLVVYVQDIVDIGVITPIALAFGRWVEMPASLQPLSPVNFVREYWNVLITIGLFTYVYADKNLFRFLHFTRQSLVWVLAIASFYVCVTAAFGVWNYNLLVDPVRTVYFWVLYPEIRVLWGLLFCSLFKKPRFLDNKRMR